ncbi:unnamed protein product, partial [Iphiclides podalirius]
MALRAPRSPALGQVSEGELIWRRERRCPAGGGRGGGDRECQLTWSQFTDRKAFEGSLKGISGRSGGVGDKADPPLPATLQSLHAMRLHG